MYSTGINVPKIYSRKEFRIYKSEVNDLVYNDLETILNF